MFFSLSKILWPLVEPLNLLFILFMAASLLVIFKQTRAGITLLLLASFLFAVIGILPLGYNAVVLLENRYHTPAEMPQNIAGIIVLGGTFDTGLSSARGRPMLNDNAERVLDALMLAKRYPSAMVIFSGGEGKLLPQGHPESQMVRDFISGQDLALLNAVYEEESRSTYENALYTKELVIPQKQEHWILITSAYHMPRAMAVFRSMGWENVTPWVTDYRTAGSPYWLPRSFNVSKNIYMTELALHEYLGFLSYTLAGKISLP
jgi:uncharacterized SAM-binding protein YcdF (DUF218 family)